MSIDVDYLKVKRTEVESSNIKSIGYHDSSHTLIIEFQSLDIYCYTPITFEGYKELMAAESIGSYFYKNIRNNNSLTYKKLF